jgi:hypothetical protein
VQIRRDNHNTDTTLFPVSAEQSLLPVFSLWPPPPPPSVHTETDERTKVDKRTGGKKEKALDGRFHLTPRRNSFGRAAISVEKCCTDTNFLSFHMSFIRRRWPDKLGDAPITQLNKINFDSK